jgi:hypothetical protein
MAQIEVECRRTDRIEGNYSAADFTVINWQNLLDFAPELYHLLAVPTEEPYMTEDEEPQLAYRIVYAFAQGLCIPPPEDEEGPPPEPPESGNNSWPSFNEF